MLLCGAGQLDWDTMRTDRGPLAALERVAGPNHCDLAWLPVPLPLKLASVLDWVKLIDDN